MLWGRWRSRVRLTFQGILHRSRPTRKRLSLRPSPIFYPTYLREVAFDPSHFDPDEAPSPSTYLPLQEAEAAFDPTAYLLLGPRGPIGTRSTSRERVGGGCGAPL